MHCDFSPWTWNAPKISYNFANILEIEEEDDDAAVVEGGTTTSPKMIEGVVMNGLSTGVGLQDGNEAEENEGEEEGKEEGTEPQKKKIGRFSYRTTAK